MNDKQLELLAFLYNSFRFRYNHMMKEGEQFLTTPENRSAWGAIQNLLHGLMSDPPDVPANPLLLHGPAGTGKTLLLQSLVDELLLKNVTICQLSANDLVADAHGLDAHADLLIIEDLQHLPIRFAEMIVQLIDDRLRQQMPIVFTALHGPSHLQHRGVSFPHRLTARLAGGLVIALDPMQAPARRRLLAALIKQNKLTVGTEIHDWLAKHLTGGGRQLAGAIRQLKTLQRLQKKPLRLDDVRTHFGTQTEVGAPTVQRIAEHVSGFYRLEPKLLRSDKRTHDVLLPRQVSMYLARQLTDLSLQQIGQYFGGRDHKTVQHACIKVQRAMKSDHALSGAVRRMHAELA